MIDTVLANFRREPIRSRELLDSAKGAPCTLRSRVCNNDPRTSVSCHVHDATFGFGQKADDCSTFIGCSACHNYVDRGEWLGDISEADMLRMILKAVLETQRYRIITEVMKIKHDSPKPFHERKTPPRKPKDLRVKVPPGRKLESTGRKIQQRNDLRRK